MRSWPVLLLALGLAACGVKNDLARPDGADTSKTENDPSRPPYPLGR